MQPSKDLPAFPSAARHSKGGSWDSNQDASLQKSQQEAPKRILCGTLNPKP